MLKRAEADLEHTELINALNRFEPITLDGLDRVRLLDRQDTKFIFHKDQLPDLLNRINPRFQALEIEDQRLFEYRTRYLDSKDLELYLQHHNGLRPRFKLRYREYTSPPATYFEIKIKNNRNRTTKHRIKARELGAEPSRDEAELVKKWLGLDPVEYSRSLDVEFSRFTLVNKAEPDRITIDIGLRMRNAGEWIAYPDLVIAEIKQPQYRPASIFIQAMRDSDIPEMRLSKYCLGILSTHDNVKYNRFKPKLRRIAKILNHPPTAEMIYA